MHYHRVLVCSRSDQHPDQTVLTDPLEKSKIPLGLFAHLHSLHEQHMGLRDTPSDDPESVHAPVDIPPKRINRKVVLTQSDMDTPIYATGKQAKVDYINLRVQQVHGKTYSQVVEVMNVPSNKHPGGKHMGIPRVLLP